MFKLKIFYSFLMLIIAFFISSCRKETDNSGVTQIVFEVGGMEDAIELKASTANLLSTSADVYLPTSITKLAGGFEFETYSKQDFMESLTDDITLKKSHVKLASTSPMQDGKTFRILMRRVGDTFWIANNQVVVGNTLHVSIEAGQQYEYIAYSYNDNSTIVDPVASNSFNISTANNKDLLYARKTFTASSGTTKEKIHFYHKVALVSVNLDMSMFASMVSSTGVEAEIVEIKYNSSNSSKDGNLYTSTLDLLTGDLSDPVSYSPGVIFNDVEPLDLGNRKNEYYTTNVVGLESVKVRLKKFVISDATMPVPVDLIAGEGVSHLDFNYIFTPAAGRPSIDLGHRLRADLLLMKPLRQMYILTGDSIYTSSYFRSGTSLHLLTNYNFTPPGYNNQPNYILGSMPGFVSEYYWSNRFDYPGAAGYMAVNFAKDYVGATPSLADRNKKYYVKGKVKVTEDIHSDMFETFNPYNPRASNLTLERQLNNPWRTVPATIPDKKPDVIIISHAYINLTEGDNDALIDYVKNHNGSVIIMADRSFYRRGTSYPINNSDWSSLPFIRSIFGSSKTDASINIGHNNTSATLNSSTIHLFKLDPNVINDPIMNGFYGYVGDSYWCAKGEFSYVTGLNDANIINYSDNKPNGSSTLPANARVMFKHKTYNVFWVGDAEFINSSNDNSGPSQNNPGYIVSTSSANDNANWRAPMTATVDSKPVNNAKIFGNFLVNSLTRAAIYRK